jgi:hypothetical protein
MVIQSIKDITFILIKETIEPLEENTKAIIRG